MSYGVRLLVPPAAEPLTLAEAKRHCYVEHNDDDDLFKRYVPAARRYAETESKRQLVEAKYKLILDRFPGTTPDSFLGTREPICLPYPPLTAVTEIRYLDSAETWTTISASDYVVDVAREPGRVFPAYGEQWPAALDRPNAVEITFLAGHLVSFTADATTNELTTSGKTFSNGEKFRVRALDGGTLPGGLAPDTDYYVTSVDSTGTIFEVSLTSGGSSVDLTSSGTAPFYLGELPDGLVLGMLGLVSHWYARREPVSERSLPVIPAGTLAALRQEWTGEIY
jgi:uncharacterized phiE125 gp8 family phage protein